MSIPASRVLGIVVCAGLITAVSIATYWVVQFERAFDAAWSTYVESRGGMADPFSTTFAVRGVEYGDSEVEVDQKMHGAVMVKRLEPARSDPPLTRLVKHYWFSYRPGLWVPFADPDYEFVFEWFQVYFDEEGRAFQLRRHLFVRKDVEQTGSVMYDLQEGGRPELESELDAPR